MAIMQDGKQKEDRKEALVMAALALIAERHADLVAHENARAMLKK